MSSGFWTGVSSHPSAVILPVVLMTWSSATTITKTLCGAWHCAQEAQTTPQRPTPRALAATFPSGGALGAEARHVFHRAPAARVRSGRVVFVTSFPVPCLRGYFFLKVTRRYGHPLTVRSSCLMAAWVFFAPLSSVDGRERMGQSVWLYSNF